MFGQVSVSKQLLCANLSVFSHVRHRTVASGAKQETKIAIPPPALWRSLGGLVAPSLGNGPYANSRTGKCVAKCRISSEMRHEKNCGAILRRVGRPFPRLASHHPHALDFVTTRVCSTFPI